MRARAILHRSTFGPEALKVATEAFDSAWAEIAHHFDGDPQIERARTQLAHAVLVTADDDSRDATALKKTALQMMALAYPRK